MTKGLHLIQPFGYFGYFLVVCHIQRMEFHLTLYKKFWELL